jgi:phage baseplate assembly protein W
MEKKEMDAGQLYGRGIAFPPHIGPDGKWAYSEGPDNIRDSIKIILFTEFNERLMLGSFGAGLRSFLFEPNTVSTHRMIQERVKNALALWEPRIAVQSIEVEIDANDGQRAIITIEYTLVSTQVAGQVSMAVDLTG